MIRGMHAMFYSSQAEALRAFFKDKLGLAGTDVGGGWLIFDAPEADLGVHPTEDSDVASGTADISFYCDDVAKTVAESWYECHGSAKTMSAVIRCRRTTVTMSASVGRDRLHSHD